jgi:hypothetical protein
LPPRTRLASSVTSQPEFPFYLKTSYCLGNHGVFKNARFQTVVTAWLLKKSVIGMSKVPQLDDDNTSQHFNQGRGARRPS